MKINRVIYGIFVLPNGDIYLEGWCPCIIKKNDFGGVDEISGMQIAEPQLGVNGDDKWRIFTPNNNIMLCNAPSPEEIAKAEILPPAVSEVSLAA